MKEQFTTLFERMDQVKVNDNYQELMKPDRDAIVTAVYDTYNWSIQQGRYERLRDQYNSAKSTYAILDCSEYWYFLQKLQLIKSFDAFYNFLKYTYLVSQPLTEEFLTEIVGGWEKKVISSTQTGYCYDFAQVEFISEYAVFSFGDDSQNIYTIHDLITALKQYDLKLYLKF